jgi:hypothetical protein
MLSLLLPSHHVPVSLEMLEFSEEHPEVRYAPIENFVRDLAMPASLLIHFQSHDGARLGTAVIYLTEVKARQTSEGTRLLLRFRHPDLMEEVVGASDLPASFILAAAKLPHGEGAYFENDPDGHVFRKKFLELTKPRSSSPG